MKAQIATQPASHAQSAGAAIVVTHKVECFDKWKPAYDSTAAWKPAFGWKRGTVLVADGDRNTVTVIEEFDAIDQAKLFAKSPELKAAMGKAGVVGAPDIRFFDLAEASRP